MKGIFKLFPVALAVVALASCSSDDFFSQSNDEELSPYRMTASVEELDPVTRSAFAEMDATHRSLVFTKGDQARITNANLVGYDIYQYNGDEVATKVDFALASKTKTINDAAFGLFPANWVLNQGMSPSDNTQPRAYFKVPTVISYGQTVTTDADALPAYLSNVPMWGPTTEASTADNPEITYYYLTGMIRVDMKNFKDGSVNTIVVKAKGNKKYLSGNFVADLKAAAPTEVQLVADTDDELVTSSFKNYIIADLAEMQYASGVIYIPIVADTYDALEIYGTTAAASDVTQADVDELNPAVPTTNATSARVYNKLAIMGGTYSTSTKLKGRPVTMNRKNVGPVELGTKTISFDGATISAINAKLASYNDDIALELSSAVATTATDYELRIPTSLAGKNITLTWTGATTGLTATAKELKISGTCQSLTIIDNATGTQGNKSVDIWAYDTNVTLEGKNFVSIDTEADVFNGMLNIGDNETTGAVETTVKNETAAGDIAIQLNGGSLYINKSATINTAGGSATNAIVANDGVEGKVGDITVYGKIQKGAIDNDGDGDITLGDGATIVSIDNSGKGAITIADQTNATTVVSGDIASSNTTSAGAITIGAKATVGGALTAAKAASVAINGTLTGALTATDAATIDVFGTVTGAIAETNAAITVGTSSTAATVTGTITAKSTSTKNINIVNGTITGGITNNGTGNITISKLAADAGAISNTKANGTNTITITDGDSKKIASVAAQKGAVSITKAEVTGDVTVVDAAITLNQVTAKGDVKNSNGTGKITLTNKSSVEVAGKVVSTKGDVEIDCVDGSTPKTFTEVSLQGVLTLKNGFIQTLTYTGSAARTYTTQGLSAIESVTDAGNKLTFASKWDGTALAEATYVAAAGKIYTAAQLAGVTGAKAAYTLMTTIDGNSKDWPGIAINATTADTEIDGNNKAITGLQLKVQDNAGFFKTIAGDKKVTIKNFTLSLDDFTAAGKKEIGVLVGADNGTGANAYENITINAKNITAKSEVGGLIGKITNGTTGTAKTRTFKNIKVNVTKITADKNMGGVVGLVNLTDAATEVTFGDGTTANAVIVKNTAGFALNTAVTSETGLSLDFGTVGNFIGNITKGKVIINKYCKHGTDWTRTVAQKEALGFKLNRSMIAAVTYYYYGGNPWVGFCQDTDVMNLANVSLVAPALYGSVDPADVELNLFKTSAAADVYTDDNEDINDR